MTETSENGEKPKVRCLVTVLQYLHKLVVIIARWFFNFIYKDQHQNIIAVKNPILLESVTSLAKKIRTKKITSEELVNAYIERINQINPILNCFVEDRFQEAIAEAKEADKLIRSGRLSEEELARDLPLLGVPFTTKDCIAIKEMRLELGEKYVEVVNTQVLYQWYPAEHENVEKWSDCKERRRRNRGLHHTAGTYIRKDVVAEEDASSVSCVRKAGAIPLGLTNVSELCMWWESHNRVHGRTNNPYNTTRGVGGSSGGEGCIQAAVGSAFGIGSDIGGSIRMPAFFNGVFGHKPSKFIVSNEGQFPVPASEYQASFLGLGPMTRKAADLRPLLKILADKNASKLKLDDKVSLKSVKVYYQMSNLNSPLVCRVETAIQKSLLKAVEHLSAVCGREAKELKIKNLAKSNAIWLANMKIKESASFAERITGVDGYLHVLVEVVKCIFGQSKNTFVGLMTALFEKGGTQPGSEKHEHFVKLRQELEDELAGILGEDGVFVYPTHPTAALYHNEPLIRAMNFSYTAIINVLGFPATHVPMGLNEEGLPIGIQIVSKTNNDHLCLLIAEELDKTFGGWVEPGSDKKKV